MDPLVADRAGSEEERLDLGHVPAARGLQFRLAALRATLSDWFEAELAERAGFPWLAVLFGTGAALYFLAPREPSRWAIILPAMLLAIAAHLAWRRGAGWRLLTVLALLFAGAGVAKIRVDALTGPEIARPTFAVLTGRVVLAETRLELRPRIVLDTLRSDDIAPDAMPRAIRLTLPAKYGLPPLGARVSVTARLTPVGGPMVPGGYDPHRAAFFDGIGGSGFVLGRWTRDEGLGNGGEGLRAAGEAIGTETTATEAPPQSPVPDPQSLSDPGSPDPPTLGLLIARVREAMVARIMAVEPGEAGAVAAALLVGERSRLSEATNESLRISGLFHILSISGLHMMLVAGTSFFATRAVLALSPALALRRPLRKWAALVALAALTFYFALSGGGPATLRSYIMALVMFAAILVDRPALSLRNLALAAIVVLALEPESVLEPGFEMSFAAVGALVAGWEVWQRREARLMADDDVLPGFRVMRFFWRAFAGVAVTTLIAGFATAPFAAHHFERFATYSLLGNLLAAPLVSVIIMPFGLLALTLMPLGLEALPLVIMARGIDALLAVSALVARLPGADVFAPGLPPWTLVLIVVGLAWLCLWREIWRLAGLAPIALGLALIPFSPAPPAILVAPDGEAVAVRAADAVLRVSGARSGSYEVEQFFDEEGGPPTDTARLRDGVRCDPLGCLLPGVDGLTVAHVRNALAFAEDCTRTAVILTPLDAPDDCAAPLVIDGPALARFGAHAVRVTPGAAGPAFTIVTDRNASPRPWQARPP